MGGRYRRHTLLSEMSAQALGARLTGTALLITYGTIILSFMAGVIWGFAAKAGGPAMGLWLVASTLPALGAFFFVTPLRHDSSLLALLLGFIGLLAIDLACARRGTAPDWWMPLRLMLTSVVVFCLVIGFLFAP